MAKKKGGRGGKDSWLLPPAAFRQRLLGSPPFAVYALVGDERFLQNELLEDIRTHVLGDGANENGFLRVPGAPHKREAGSFKVAELLDELRSLSLFAPRKVIVLQPADHVVEAHRDAFTAYLDAPASASSLVLLLKNVDGRTAFAKRLKGDACLGAACRTPYDRPSPWQRGKVPDHDNELTHWLRDRARTRHDRSLSLQTAYLLAELVGSDLGVLASSLEKLAMLSRDEDGGEITPEHVLSVTASSSGQTAFELAESFLSRNRSALLAITRRIARNGLVLPDGKLKREPREMAPMILGALQRSVLRFRRARQAIAEGKNARAALEGLGVNKWFVEQAVAQLRRWTDDDLERVLLQLAELEQRAKTGRQSNFVAELEMLFLKVA